MSSTLFLNGLSALLTQYPLLASLGVPVLLILVDVVTGIASACKQGIFSLKQFSAFLSRGLLQYLTVVLAVSVSYLVTGSESASTLISVLGMGSLSVATLGSILSNLQELGVSPDVVQEVQQVGDTLLGKQAPTYAYQPNQQPAVNMSAQGISGYNVQPGFSSAVVGTQSATPSTMNTTAPSGAQIYGTSIANTPVVTTATQTSTFIPEQRTQVTPSVSIAAPALTPPQPPVVPQQNTTLPVPQQEVVRASTPPVQMPQGF